MHGTTIKIKKIILLYSGISNSRIIDSRRR
jgi:hypothetical protein